MVREMAEISATLTTLLNQLMAESGDTSAVRRTIAELTNALEDNAALRARIAVLEKVREAAAVYRYAVRNKYSAGNAARKLDAALAGCEGK
jgi:hypothetical protein